MSNSTTPALRRWTAALAIATAGSLSLVGSANADIYPVATGPALQQAVIDANGNPGHDKIILANGFLSLTQQITITGDLTITSDHVGVPLSNPGPLLEGSNVPAPPVGLKHQFTINAGATVRMEGWSITQSSESNAAVFFNNGTLIMDGMAVAGNLGLRQIWTTTGSSTTLNNTTLTENLGAAIFNRGALTLNNSTIIDNFGGGINSNPAMVMRNSFNGNNEATGLPDCVAPLPAVTTGSYDSDGTCGAALTASAFDFDANNTFGGPTTSRPLLAGSVMIDGASPSLCPTTDQRFFVRDVGTSGPCDVGAIENGALQDTTPPTCVVTDLRLGPPKQQDVTLRDAGSGIGSNGVWPEQVTIANGTVAFTPFPTPFRSPASAQPPSNGGLVLTATKGDQLLVTQWSFTARDWAGNVRNCA